MCTNQPSTNRQLQLPDFHTAYARWHAAQRPANAPPPSQLCARFGAALRFVFESLTAPAPAGLQAVLSLLLYDANNASTALVDRFPGLPGATCGCLF